MPKTLFVVRHAKSNWDHPDLRDFDRPLNKRGLRDAPKMGTRLKTHKALPEIIICSTAKRARETLQHLNLGINTIHFEPNIYEAPVQILIEIINSIDDSVGSAMLIGHNPGMSWLVTLLTGVQIDAMPTCAIAEIRLATESWSTANRSPSELINLDYPKK